MNYKVELSAQEILDEKFEKDVKGYNPEQVDAFLDRIIHDYVAFNQYEKDSEAYVKGLEEKLEQAEGSIKELKLSQDAAYETKKKLEIENASMKNRLSDIKPGDKVNADNIEYIARLNRLETFLYSIGYDPKTLKKNS
ncbi:MAG: DivIVA domain-containing protein [Bacilli bacterium]|jgi:DivIVA domain-containing protein|nr:DivIVA domain-containing protein [Bacilli bacterium]MCH4228565.1 DivIVA domain-containing protein [Bacilli bacterium]MCI2055241.1 DivIVA domain-containing protein [Bacilli bacterium]